MQGGSCEFCEPLYVGDARNNGSCVSCYNMCNKKADVCMNSTQLDYGRSRNFSFDPSEVCRFLHRIFFAVRPGYRGLSFVVFIELC